MSKSSAEYLSEPARKLLSNPARAKEFLKEWVHSVPGACGCANGKDFKLDTEDDVENLDDQTAVWLAVSQAGFEKWLEEHDLE